jgi:hypothetical protein
MRRLSEGFPAAGESELQRAADRRFVVVSGLPGSGKSRIAQQLAPLLKLAVIDKDDILEKLFESRSVIDAVERRILSHKSDQLFRRQAEAAPGAILVFPSGICPACRPIR